MSVIWEDSRIKGNFVPGTLSPGTKLYNSPIKLPPVKKNDPSLIWNPFQDDGYYIDRLIERKFTLDPIMVSRANIFSSNTLRTKAFPPNITLVTAGIE